MARVVWFFIIVMYLFAPIVCAQPSPHTASGDERLQLVLDAENALIEAKEALKGRRPEEARQYLADAQRLFTKGGSVGNVALIEQLNIEISGASALNKGTEALRSRRIEEARQHLADAQRLFTKSGSVENVALIEQLNIEISGASALNKGTEALRSRRIEEALQHFADAQRLFTQSGNVENVALIEQLKVKLGGESALNKGTEALDSRRVEEPRQPLADAQRASSQIDRLDGASAAIVGSTAVGRAENYNWLATGSFVIVLMLAAIVIRKFSAPRKRRTIQQPASTSMWHTVSTPNSDTVIVFVHGIFSSQGAAWAKWPEIIASDPRVQTALGTAPDVFLAGYHTALDSGGYKIEHAADALRVQLRTANVDGQTPALTRTKIIFIAHSTGGIVVRDVMERFRDDFSGKKVGLVLMASPSRGSAWAKRLELLARLGNNKMAQQLSPNNDYLTNLDRRFADFVQRPPYLLKGLDVFEQKFIIPNRFFATLFSFEPVVNPDAQSSYFGSPRTAAGTDHFSIVKPADASHPSHEYFVDFLTHTFVSNTKSRYSE